MSKNEQYVSFMDSFIRGEAPTQEQFLYHFEHQNGMPTKALEVGANAPDFGLVDQFGARRSLPDTLGDRGLLLVFARSAYWCPYCRNQLAELNIQTHRLRAAGYEIVAITSDPPHRIKEFCDQHDVRYPILSDPTGIAMEAYGVRNEDIPPTELQGGGPMPHPGHFLISTDRRIMAREFTGDIRHRVSATTLIAEASDPDGDGVRLATEDLSAVIALSAAQAFGGQELAVMMSVTVAPGVHVYGATAQPPYAPLSLSFDDALLAEQTFHFPDAEPMRLDALDETLPVLDGDFVIRGRIRLRWSPPKSPFAELADFVASQAIAPGDYRLTGTVRYQACSDTECFAPQSVRFELPLEIRANARAGAAVKFGDFEIPAPTE